MKVNQANPENQVKEPFKWKYSIPRIARKKRKEAKNDGKLDEFKHSQILKLIDRLNCDRIFASIHKIAQIDRKIKRLAAQL